MACIHGDHKELVKFWRKESLEKIDEQKARDLTALNRVEKQAWDDLDDCPIYHRTRFYDIILKCQKQRAEILGYETLSVSVSGNTRVSFADEVPDGN